MGETSTPGLTTNLKADLTTGVAMSAAGADAREATWAQDRCVLITGATSGFGLALAKRLLAGGGRVIGIGRRRERLEEIARDHPDRFAPMPLDLRDGAAIDALPAALPSGFSQINALVNNAGLAMGLDPAHRAAWADWQTMIETNVLALARLTHHLLPAMTQQARGDIINVSSVAANYPYPGGNVYGATKAFVRQFSLNLRADLLGTPVRVTSIEPGMCETEFSVVRFRGDADAAGRVYQGMQPLSAEDVAHVIETVLRLPAHINVNTLEVMPIAQAFGPFAVHRSANP